MINSKSMMSDLAPEFHADGVAKIPGFGPCIYKLERDLVKVIRVKVKKAFGSHVIYADIAILSKFDFLLCQDPKVKGDNQPASLTICPLMNFHDLMKYGYLENGKPTKAWISMVQALFAALPSCMKIVESLFDRDFAKLQPLARVPIFVRHVESLVNFDVNLRGHDAK